MYRSTILLVVLALALFIKAGESVHPAIHDASGKLELALLLAFLGLSLVLRRRYPQTVVLFFALVLAAQLVGFSFPPNRYEIGQFIVDVKFPLAIVAAYSLVSERLVLRRLPLILNVAVALCLVFVLVQMVAPGAFKMVFQAAAIDTRITGTQFRRSTGFFIYPGPFGIFAAVSMLFFYALGKYRGWRNDIKFGFLGSFVCLVMSGQRLEILCVVVLMASLYVLEHGRRPLPLLVLLFTAFGGSVFFGSGLWDIYQKVSANFSGDLSQNEMVPRAALLQGAAKLAAVNFPTGAGLATFGGSMSLVNPNHAYGRAGLASVWWYGKNSFLTDTYWAMPIGELGWLGAVVLLVAYLYLFAAPMKAIVRKGDPKLRFAAQATFLVLGFAFLDSVGAPIYTGSLLPILLAATLYAYFSLVSQTCRKDGQPCT